MCGIFGIIENNTDKISKFSRELLEQAANKGAPRGPESKNFLEINNIFLGFHRLAINGLDPKSDQPLTHGKYKLICNGEIYNYRDLYKELNIKPDTGSDCEVILWLYERYGIMETLTLLDGVFSFILYDESNSCIYVARDPLGVRPLFVSSSDEDWEDWIGFSSELKQLCDLKPKKIEQFTPGTFLKYNLTTGVKQNITYTSLGLHRSPYGIYSEYLDGVFYHLMMAVHKRVENTDRPIACLLSGGLDSSIICGLVNSFAKDQIETYSIGLEGAEDLKYAKIMADHLDSKHTNIIVTEDEFFDAIREVIYAIESYDTTTVRASVGNYLVAKYISKNSRAKVIFNGDGSDELTGGYLYCKAAPDLYAFDGECRRLLKDICFFDVLRSDRSVAAHGLEPRTPFLDRNFVDYYLSLPAQLRFPNKNPEKHLLRKAIEKNNILPKEILWRTKEAFSDGVSNIKRSWYHIIQEKIEQLGMSDQLNEATKDIKHNYPKTMEQKYYRMIYEEYYGNYANVIPYFWMPKFVDATDASARTLKIYCE